MVDSSSLLNCSLRKGTGGSNPSLSAGQLKKYGRVAERFKAAVLKTVEDESPPRVRISPLPPYFERERCQSGLSYSFAKAACPNRHREFESPPLRYPRARVNARTCPAPFSLSTRAHSPSVEPVVNTSSTTMMFLFFISVPFWRIKAFFIFSVRSCL